MGLGKELGFSVCLRVRGCSIKGSRDYSIDYSGGRRGGLLLISVAPDTLSLSHYGPGERLRLARAGKLCGLDLCERGGRKLNLKTTGVD